VRQQELETLLPLEAQQLEVSVLPQEPGMRQRLGPLLLAVLVLLMELAMLRRLAQP